MKKWTSRDPTLCGFCLDDTPATASVRQCPCERQVYCSETCQKKHWKMHKATCTKRPSALETCGFCGTQEGKVRQFEMCHCQEMMYCSQSCQKKHWKAHKVQCSWRKARKLEKTGAEASADKAASNSQDDATVEPPAEGGSWWINITKLGSSLLESVSISPFQK